MACRHQRLRQSRQTKLTCCKGQQRLAVESLLQSVPLALPDCKHLYPATCSFESQNKVLDTIADQREHVCVTEPGHGMQKCCTCGCLMLVSAPKKLATGAESSASRGLVTITNLPFNCTGHTYFMSRKISCWVAGGLQRLHKAAHCHASLGCVR